MRKIFTKVLEPYRDPDFVERQGLFVDRADDLLDIKESLKIHVLQFDGASPVVLVVGERGVGKTVLCRKAVNHLQEEVRSQTKSSTHLLLIHVEIQGVSEAPNMLRKMFSALQESVAAFAETHPTIFGQLPQAESYANQLQAVANFIDANSFQKSQLEESMRQIGIKGEVSGGVWELFKAKFGLSWSRSWKDSTTTQVAIDLTEPFLLKVFNALLQQAVDSQFVPLLFIDDIDRAAPFTENKTFDSMMTLLSDVGPSLILVPMRPYMVQPHLTRRASVLNLKGLEEEHLERLLLQSIEAESDEVKRKALQGRFSTDVCQKLIQMTGNPLTLLNWANSIAKYPNFKGLEDIDDAMERVATELIINDTQLSIFKKIVQRLKEHEAESFDGFVEQKALETNEKTIEWLLRLEMIEPDDLLSDQPRVRLTSAFKFLKEFWSE